MNPESVLSTHVAIEDPLATAIQLEEDRETNKEGDCEGQQLLPLSILNPLAASTALSKADKQKLRKKLGKKARQQRKKQAVLPTAYKLRSTWVKRFECPQSIRAKVDAQDLPVATNAWIGTKMPIEEAHPTLKELKDKGYRHIEWDGK